MKDLFCTTCLILLITLSFALPTRAEEPSLDKFAALAAAEQFLLLLDQGNYQECWDEASELFRTAANKLKWEEQVGHMRDQYGAFISRQLRFAKEMQNLEGVPQGEYYFLIYGSSFAARDSVIETMTMRKEEDGRWRVSGYTIK